MQCYCCANRSVCRHSFVPMSKSSRSASASGRLSSGSVNCLLQRKSALWLRCFGFSTCCTLCVPQKRGMSSLVHQVVQLKRWSPSPPPTLPPLLLGGFFYLSLFMSSSPLPFFRCHRSLPLCVAASLLFLFFPSFPTSFSSSFSIISKSSVSMHCCCCCCCRFSSIYFIIFISI